MSTVFLSHNTLKFTDLILKSKPWKKQFNHGFRHCLLCSPLPETFHSPHPYSESSIQFLCLNLHFAWYFYTLPVYPTVSYFLGLISCYLMSLHSKSHFIIKTLASIFLAYLVQAISTSCFLCQSWILKATSIFQMQTFEMLQQCQPMGKYCLNCGRLVRSPHCSSTLNLKKCLKHISRFFLYFPPSVFLFIYLFTGIK